MCLLVAEPPQRQLLPAPHMHAAAGALTTHVAAGVSALVAALAVGGARQAAPGAHNSPMTAVGMILLWIGWLGQASGSAAIAGTSTAAALINVQACLHQNPLVLSFSLRLSRALSGRAVS